MEHGFQSLLLAGKYGTGDGAFSPFQISDDTFLSPSLKRLKHEHSTPVFTSNHLPNLQSLEDLKTQEETRRIVHKFSTPAPPPEKLPYAEVAYRRRQTVSEKTRKLQKLLPMDKKMDIATVYEESYNYIQFLKAQISSLESMPVECSGSNFRSGNPNNNINNNNNGVLGELNRQEVLEMLVNSPETQAVMYTKGLCVYSIEQLMLFTSHY